MIKILLPNLPFCVSYHCSCRFNVDHTGASTLEDDFSDDEDDCSTEEDEVDVTEASLNTVYVSLPPALVYSSLTDHIRSRCIRRLVNKQSDTSDAKYFRRITLALQSLTMRDGIRTTLTPARQSTACTYCEKPTTPLGRRGPEGQPLCNACGFSPFVRAVLQKFPSYSNHIP